MPDYLVCYDIADPRRLARLHRFLKKRAFAIQYSVFLLHADRRAADALMQEAVQLIDEDTDDLRCYRLSRRGFAVRLGRATLPQGVCLTAFPAPMRGFLAAPVAPEDRKVHKEDRRETESASSSGRSEARDEGGIGRSKMSGRPYRKRAVQPLRRRGTYTLR